MPSRTSFTAPAPGRLRSRLAPAIALGLLGLVLAWTPWASGGGAAAAGAAAVEEPTPQTDASVPLRKVTMLGSSPGEAPAETWGIGEVGEGVGETPTGLVRYTPQGGWTLGPSLQDESGHPLAGFKPDTLVGAGAPSPLTGQMTEQGAGVLVGTVPSGSSVRQVLLVRDPGGAFKETAPVLGEGEEPLLASGESLFSNRAAPMVAALDEGGGVAGALVVPVTQGGATERQVLHWDGHKWTSEPIEVPGESEEEKRQSGFQVLAIAASSPANAWLLAQPSPSQETLVLYRRHEGRWLAAGSALAVHGEDLYVAGSAEKIQSQLLTATSQGVWVDGELPTAKLSATVFFEIEGEGGQVAASWCAGGEGPGPCTFALPEPLPSGSMRSFAWAGGSSPYGERVITGFSEGVTLRLDGTSFDRVLALGGTTSRPPGRTYGAAFSSAREGWLGEEQLPVHLTLHPLASRLTPWPVSFRHALLAAAPEPNAPVGASTSGALAVGDLGEVARYRPGEGWLPESLLGPGGRFMNPRLVAVAWPTTVRAYAVGEKEGLGEIWLWRGETGLWEKDPATPVNLRANLLGIAFDPANSARGYVIGAGGVLLRFGKTWTPDALPAEAPCAPSHARCTWANAAFTSIAFAGSEAIVAYRVLLDPSTDRYEGGLIVNSGTGWHVDQGAVAAASGRAPWAVAGLADGGAAFSDEGYVYERSGPGAPWQRDATPLPGGGEPGSLALFREGGALRAIAAGTPPDFFDAESATPAPPGSPPTLIPPYALVSNPAKGLLRQSVGGWSDEEHELNDVREPQGNFVSYDTVYEPDPIASVLIDPSGSHGWAIGGFVEPESHGGVLDTSDIERYPSDGSAPVGEGASAMSVQAGQVGFAIGGGAQCAAPCADRARAGIGPDVWLASAVARAGQIAGVRAFVYTGPRVTAGQTHGTRTVAIPYEREFARYRELLASGPLPSFAAPSPTELDEAHSETPFREAFANECAGAATSGCYFSFGSGGVKVVVLDDSGDVDAVQREWLARELAGAKGASEPAIVVGNADLNGQIAAGDEAAQAVAQTLISGGASAYFYDAPERNVQAPLRGSSIPTFGSGTLGYVGYQAEQSGEFLGASGFLLGQVEVAARNPATNVAPVTARLIPNVGELALEAREGTLLHRSQVARFEALARRPRSGNRAENQSTNFETDPYIPIPSNCIGSACAEGIFPEYTFTSSRPDVGDFVKRNLASPNPLAVLLDAHGDTIPDPGSELFCAYNAGTTIVTISAGGLSASLPVTVQAGSVRRPCGTVPLKEVAAKPGQVASPPPAAAPAGSTPAQSSPAPIPVPPPPAPVSVPSPAHPAPLPFFVPGGLSAPPLAFVPPPVPTPARPTPPSGTSPVTSPVEVAEHEEEDEHATESVSNQAVAYRRSEDEPAPLYVLGIVLLAAFAGAAGARRRRPARRNREIRVAAATVSTARSQRRWEREHRGRRVMKW